MTRTSRIDLRYAGPDEMERLLARTGFTIRERYGDFDRRPLTPESPRMVYVCKPADSPKPR